MSTAVPKTAGAVTIRYVVMSVLNRMQDYSLKNYKRLVQIAIEGFTELSLWHLNSVEVVYLHMSTAKTVQLPSDYVDYNKIGIPINGQLRVITRKDCILLPRVFDDTQVPVGNNTPSNIDQSLTGVVFFDDHWKGGQFIGGLFGMPGGIDSAYYRIDRENRQIVFSGDVPRSEIVLEYVSSGVKESGGTMIPREAVPALRTYVEWQMIAGDMLGMVTGRAQMKTAFGEISRRKQEHEEAVSMLRSFQNSFTIEEYKRAIYSTSRQSPKR
jgi:hypothetical protein